MFVINQVINSNVPLYVKKKTFILIIEFMYRHNGDNNEKQIKVNRVEFHERQIIAAEKMAKKSEKLFEDWWSNNIKYYKSRPKTSW